jgi:hypothetical protein
MRLFGLISLTASLLSGCVAYPYKTTPAVEGRVVDSTTGTGIAGAKVGFRDRAKAVTSTAPDGSFRLKEGHTWGGALLIPWEFTACGGVLYVEAPGYQPVALVAAPQSPNKAPEPTTTAVTIRAPSSTDRASRGRGSS